MPARPAKLCALILLAACSSSDTPSLSLDAGAVVDGRTADAALTLDAAVAPDAAPVAVDRYVDPANGDDGNAGSQGAPLQSITKAAASAQSGATLFLAAGSYTNVTEKCPSCNPLFVTVRTDVTVQAVTAGTAILNGIAFNVQDASATFTDLGFAGIAAGIVGSAATAGKTVTISGTRFAGNAGVSFAGMVSATMSPGTLVGSYTTNRLNGGFGTLTQSASLRVQGGSFDGGGMGIPSFGGGFFAMNGSSQLVLDGVTLENYTAAGVSVNSSVPAQPAQVTLQNGARFDTVGGTGNCGANAAVVLTGVPVLTVDDGAIVDSPGVAICVRDGSGAAVITLANATLSGNGAGIAYENVLAGATATIHITDSTFTMNSAYGLTWAGAGTIDIAGTTFRENGTGLELDHGVGGSLGVKVRGSSFLDSTTYGFRLNDASGSTAYTLDLGTTADPGGNVFTGNVTSGLSIGPPAAIGVSARGNRWIAGEQGADGAGHYGATTVTGPVTVGQNYRLVNASTLDL